MNSPACKSPRRPRWSERLQHFILGPNPLHPAVWNGRLRPMTFRRFALADLPQCLELYKLNAPGRFPEGVIAQYEKSLREQSSYFLVAEKDGRIIATGGMSFWVQPHLVSLCFGLVHPGHQGQGVGTALLLARLALLGGNAPVYRAYIFAVKKSFGFYQRFGFREFTPWHDEKGAEHPSGELIFKSEEAIECRKLLVEHGISVPHEEDQIPIRKKTDEEKSA